MSSAREPGAGKVAALPRSRLHLQFLVDNGAEPDLVLYRDAFMRGPVETQYPGRALDLGRETLPRGSLSSLLAARRANAAYYRSVAASLHPLGIERLILFLEGEPLERFLMALPGIRAVELWEDGLSHYTDLTSPLWYAARGAVQAAVGFHPRGILNRRIDRSKVRVRDRFEQRNLVLSPPTEPGEQRDALLFVGSPLVEDGIIRHARFLAAMRQLGAASPMAVRYLPHPREDLTRLQADLAGIGNVEIEPNAGGLMEHAGRFGYRAYAAAISTGLLDLGRFDQSAYVPQMFGCARMARALSQWPANPVRLVADGQALREFLAQH
ncbi:hypothetical protein [Sphingomonas desiccabilis]|uniref:Uncharacterized protein n=1 Tax=Sphingomonas desiccabilis TaxID=429134 RepID=A0A4Q2IVV1_9SPHN|nr:hypothetical protein [Sphingomonas desiccabilis]MBB3910002.1 hypothetical protein [Sphingomonas desiccabilis]RXZ34705.1 hypothetical protein EO081_03280 [Sphingomonas desiccabilis]